MTTVHDLITTLQQTRIETLDIVHQLDIEEIVFAKSGWRVHDIMTHLTWSDEQATAILKAFLTDKVYQPPPHLVVRSRRDMDRRNAWIRRQYYLKPAQEVLSDFIESNQKLHETLFKVGTIRLFDQFSAPWGDRITPHTLAIWQIQHDQLHRRDLQKVLGYPNVLDNRVYRLVYSEV